MATGDFVLEGLGIQKIVSMRMSRLSRLSVSIVSSLDVCEGGLARTRSPSSRLPQAPSVTSLLEAFTASRARATRKRETWPVGGREFASGLYRLEL